MKKAITMLVVILLVGSLFGCSNAVEPVKDELVNVEATTEEVATEEGKDYTIAVVPKDNTDPWFVRMEEGVVKFSEETGLNAFQKGSAETDATMQAQIITDLIAQQVDAICVVPVDPAALELVLGKALDAGIVVVTHEGSTQENTLFNIEAFDNNAYGAFIMDNLAAAMGEEGKYVTMVGHITNASHNEWADGAIERQKDAYPNMVLIEEDMKVESQDDGEIAYQKAKEILKKYPDLKGIIGTSSYDSPGVARAIEELGLQGKVFTCGTGMPEENKAILEKGLVPALTLWDPADAGYAMCSLAQMILDGEEVTDGIDLGLEGYTNMKLVGKQLLGAGWVTITKENVDSFGF